jgi:hypothetical protein
VDLVDMLLRRRVVVTVALLPPPLLLLLLLLLQDMLGMVSAADPALETKAKPPPGECRCAATDLSSGEDHGGNDIRADTEKGKMTAQECCDRCRKAEGCRYWALEDASQDGKDMRTCWLKKLKGPKTSDKPAIMVAGSLNSTYASNTSFCHGFFGGGDLGWMVVAVIVLGGGMYAVVPMALGHGKHPHATSWRELQALCRDGLAFARSRGASRRSRVHGGSIEAPLANSSRRSKSAGSIQSSGSRKSSKGNRKKTKAKKSKKSDAESDGLQQSTSERQASSVENQQSAACSSAVSLGRQATNMTDAFGRVLKR